MSITDVQKDFEARTVTLIADFEAAVDQVWELWADPRKLERWWGPPSYPATAEPPTSLEFTDGFADQEGNPAEGMPVTSVRVTLSEHDGGTRMELRSVFESQEEMQQLLDMGAVEGIQQSIGQMDALLAEGARL
jgi:uncharacterized protein YndB with AHSA1/START domain